MVTVPLNDFSSGYLGQGDTAKEEALMLKSAKYFAPEGTLLKSICS